MKTQNNKIATAPLSLNQRKKIVELLHQFLPENKKNKITHSVQEIKNTSLSAVFDPCVDKTESPVSWVYKCPRAATGHSGDDYDVHLQTVKPSEWVKIVVKYFASTNRTNVTTGVKSMFDNKKQKSKKRNRNAIAVGQQKLI